MSYSKSGGGQEEESSLPESFTAITSNDLLIGAGFTGSLRSSHSPDKGPIRLASIRSKIDQWHSAFIDACQDRLFVRDHRRVEKTRNLTVEKNSSAQASKALESMPSGPKIFCQVMIPSHQQPLEGPHPIMHEESDSTAQASTIQESPLLGPLGSRFMIIRLKNLKC